MCGGAASSATEGLQWATRQLKVKGTYVVAEYSVPTYQVNQQLLARYSECVQELVSVERLHWMHSSPCAQSCPNVHIL